MNAVPGGWQWPENIPDARHRFNPSENEPSTPNTVKTESSPEDPPEEIPTPTAHTTTPKPEPAVPKQRHYKPRTCRICLETVLPTFHAPSENIPGIFQSTPKVTYESEDGGRLLRPCKCKGTAQYVHEGCLQSWRHADPGYARRNYFQCPTCGYKYRLQRLGWGTMISSVAAQITLTLLILITTMFVMGFIADPVIDFAIDPYGTIFPFFNRGRTQYNVLPDDDASGWIEHFTKGLASLGLLSFLKVLFASPVQFFFRSSAVPSRGGTSGRDRLSNMTWLFIIIGVATFLYTVWKGVRAWSRRTLEKAGERVMDVQVDDDNDDQEEESPSAPSSGI
ncbi:hypothetical protein EJ08DRAFT_687077 [Tothia fuscella]|uniref:RING-CH-type domain-containing protein n=1 Tax=Tothia fuscella TaxID=1048955 RepID=A0A9P4NVP2_9PEZI|nr:hypothetical protein EJ08DRAFT_687077 [Tothia fuscella]